MRREQSAIGRQAGFTLIEILVVLAIMVILAAIVAPFGARPRERAALAKDAREIAEALRLTPQPVDRDQSPDGLSGRCAAEPLSRRRRDRRGEVCRAARGLRSSRPRTRS